MIWTALLIIATGIATATLLGFISYLIIRFIERND
jgi:hypothetical protein